MVKKIVEVIQSFTSICEVCCKLIDEIKNISLIILQEEIITHIFQEESWRQKKNLIYFFAFKNLWIQVSSTKKACTLVDSLKKAQRLQALG